ncbi:MAG TPA: hypothetical protein VKB84_07030 [Candidatus Binataceae bacterium]|nr:hypothetical protein [Candidatus Binataceae bacterium]
MEYILEIYRPGRSNADDCIKTFKAAAPFLPISVGDLLSTKDWDQEGTHYEPLLRVVNVEHLIFDRSTIGIDPGGMTVHRMLVYTESVPNSFHVRSSR